MANAKDKEKKENEIYDVVIIGGGPSGLSAAIYSARYLLKTLVISQSVGGQIAESPIIENYPGFESISGMALSKKFEKQAEMNGASVKFESVLRVEKEGKLFSIVTDSSVYRGNVIILAIGTSVNKLEIPGEQKLIGRGVSYCATCDANFFRKKTVAVVGGGDSAMSSALLLSDIAGKVYIIHRRNEFRAEPVKVKRLKERRNVEFILESAISEIHGEKKVEKITVEDLKTKGKKNIDLDGVFIQAGAVPSRVISKILGVDTDSGGYIIVDGAQRTNVPKVLASGDVTTNSDKFRQIATAVGEGAVAAHTAYKIIREEAK